MVSAVVEEFKIPLDWQQKVTWSIFKKKTLCVNDKDEFKKPRSKGLYQIKELTAHLIEFSM